MSDALLTAEYLEQVASSIDDALLDRGIGQRTVQVGVSKSDADTLKEAAALLRDMESLNEKRLGEIKTTLLLLAEARREAAEAQCTLPFAILEDEMQALRRFHECVTDNEGYDVPKPMMRRLSEIGLLRRVTANLYGHTIFGLSILNGDFDQSAIEQARREERERIAAWVEKQRNAIPATGIEFSAAILAPNGKEWTL
jgi:hypothetical protein